MALHGETVWLLLVVHIVSVIGFITLKKYHLAERLRSSDIHPANLGKTALQLGGVIIVPLILAVNLFTLNYFSVAPIKLQILVILPFVLLFLTGLLDDFQSIKAPIRLMIHFINTTSIIIAIYQVTNFEGLNVYTANLGVVIPAIFLILATTWMINTTNFIDGMDLFLFLAILPGSLLAMMHYSITGYDVALSFVFSIFVSALLGFAWFNMPKACIYMGDSGTLCIGLLLGGYSSYILAEYGSIAGFIPFAYILVDATFTLLMRLKNKKYIFKSHNQHAYQIARQLGKSETSIRSYCFIVSVLNTLFAYLCLMMDHVILWQLLSGVAAFSISTVVFFIFKKPQENT